jgi:hypothetical protein
MIHALGTIAAPDGDDSGGFQLNQFGGPSRSEPAGQRHSDRIHRALKIAHTNGHVVRVLLSIHAAMIGTCSWIG